MARPGLCLVVAILAVSLAGSAEGKNGTSKGDNCRDYEPTCGDVGCCNGFYKTCLSIPISKTEKQMRCVDSVETMKRQRWPFVVLMPLFFTPFILVATCAGAFFGSKHGGEAGWVGDALLVLGTILTFLSFFLLYTPSLFGGMMIAFAGQLSVIMSCTTKSRVVSVGLVAQMFLFFLWFNPFSNNVFLASGTEGKGIFGQMDAMIDAAAKPASFSYGTTTPVTTICTDFYAGYFAYSADERGDGDNNPVIPSWGYCGLGWLTTVYIFMIPMLMVHIFIFVFTFLHWADLTNRDSSKLGRGGSGAGAPGGGQGVLAAPLLSQ